MIYEEIFPPPPLLANLAAFLTAEMLERPIESAEDLSRQSEEHILTQTLHDILS